MDIKQFAGDGVDDMTNFDAFYDEVIRRLGGVAAVRGHIPFPDETLVESYRRDRNLNDRLTHIKRWDEAADDLRRFLASHGVTCSAQSQRVCILKRAAQLRCDPSVSTAQAVDVALARLEAETRIRGRLVEAPFPGSLRF